MKILKYVYYCCICGEPIPKRINKTDYCSEPCRIESIKRYNERMNYAEKNNRRLDRTSYLKMRFKILTRDNFACKYCGRDIQDGIKLVIDHIKPISKSGTNAPENLITACTDCNNGKKDVLLNQKIIKKLKDNIADMG